MKKVAAVSFSGGKDSTLSLYYTLKSGYDVKYLVNFISKKYKRSSFHGLPYWLIKEQARCIGIKLLQYEVDNDKDDYGKIFISMLKELKRLKVNYFVCGDIYLEEHPNWIKERCKIFDLILVEPLWKKDPYKVIEEFLNFDFKAKIVSVNAKILNKSFVGKEISYSLIDEIASYGCCICGENGEYHTFVYDGPIFNKSIILEKVKIVYRKSFWPAWFLDILKVKKSIGRGFYGRI
ncbi:MAG: diphthine--ammonia ligase [Endomicrobia bacterium]|nr:diphthine--ammonia ligase [Endomicrobiia bacterium]